jgi:hypothetical protein
MRSTPKCTGKTSFQDFLDLLRSDMNNYKRFAESLKIDRDE